ncbi:terpenoid synthase [Gloeophyllum trabeum ATCC 11539]|uniref:Terpenoid synthase n=1 Tax=Gloeophyllum trabeum (strain ATCC 11539 / FP-39264 / Madison 617) TaxID=670483 RepID=S7PWE8_GLOTA|nr:terpenoid synthase [Gloeophyllum trabeum ATCC 11539]EPQ51652.1 terpenoid synthase [Gloeophyllum trabeum ATCC 11539]
MVYKYPIIDVVRPATKTVGPLSTDISSRKESSNAGSFDYKARINQFLHDIGYRYEPTPSADPEFLLLFHDWIITEVQPVSGLDEKRIAAIENWASSVPVWCYPYADLEPTMLMSKLTALALIIDDSLLNDNAVHKHIALFTHRLYMGEPQPAGTILPLYEECIRALSTFIGEDGVLRGMAVTPWITYMEAASLEKRIQAFDEEVRASPFDAGTPVESLVSRRGQGGVGIIKLGADAIAFPHFLREKTGVNESYAAIIFKASRKQELPLTRYIKAVPDISFTVAVVNDILSFHKEELQGETINLVHLLTQCLAPTQKLSGQKWDVNDTLELLCEQLKNAFLRIDSLLRLEEFDGVVTGDEGLNENADRIMDMQIAKQWRAWRDGYISWHLESGRYQLDFLGYGCDSQ